MMRGFIAVGMIGTGTLLAAAGHARAEDLVTLSGKTYHDVHAVRVDVDGVTWQYDGGVTKIDFDDSPEAVRRAYHYDAARAAEFREAQAKARKRAEEQAQADARLHEARQEAQAQNAQAQLAASNADVAVIFQRSLSPAASQATREMAVRMREGVDQRAATAAASGDPFKLVPTLPGIFGPRPLNPTMNTPDSKEFAASLHTSPTGASTNFTPSSADPSRSNLNDGFYSPDYSTRSYYEDLDRAAAFALGVPGKP